MLNKKSIGQVGLINAASAGLGLLYSVVLARSFGVGSDIEIYFASTTLLFLINSLSQSGQLAEIALPVYHRFQHSGGQESASRVLSVVINWMMLIALVLTLAALAGARPLFTASASGFEPEKLEKGIALFRMVCPLLFLEILKSQLTTIVNAEKKFGRIELVNITNQLVSIAFVLLFSPALGIYAVVAGFWLGELVSVGYGLYLIRQTQFRYHPVLRHPGFTLRDMLKNLGYTFSYVVITQIMLLFLNNLITHLPKGQYAVFKYTQLIFTKIQGLLIRPVSVIFFSQFSSAFHSRSQAVRDLVVEASGLGFILSVTVFSWLVALAHPLLGLMWEGEKFDSFHIGLIYTSLVWFSLTVFFNSYALIYRKIAMTLGQVRNQYLGYIAVQLLTMAMLYVCRPLLSLNFILWTYIFNACLLCLVPLLISIRYKEIRIPVSAGKRPPARWMYFVLTILLAFLVREAGFGEGNAARIKQLLLAFPLMTGGSLALAIALGLEEIKWIRPAVSRLLHRP